MIQIGDTWEIGRMVYYVDEEDKTLVKEAHIKEVHEEILREEPRPLGKVVSYKKTLFLDNGDEISIQNAFTSKEEVVLSWLGIVRDLIIFSSFFSINASPNRALTLRFFRPFRSLTSWSS